ncbi:MAG: RecX family transcriptional regulator [Anaerolineales bacterium]|nr:MAG: RecX family transcriptional regulator [Anaerolineales bacterium]
MGRKITGMQIQKHNKQRVNIYLDGEFAFGLARILTAWLKTGQELSKEKIAQLLAEDEREAAFQKAVKFLSYRDRTEAEIHAHLVNYGASENIISEIVVRLKQNGLIDDNRFASTWVENRTAFRPRGRQALTYELKQKGIALHTIDKALEDIDEDELAYRAAQKHQNKISADNWLDFRKKLYAHLARRGFSYEIIATTVQKVWSERHNTSIPDHETQFEEVDE